MTQYPLCLLYVKNVKNSFEFGANGNKKDTAAMSTQWQAGEGDGGGGGFPLPAPQGNFWKITSFKCHFLASETHFLQMPFSRIWDSIQYAFVSTQCNTLSYCFNDNDLLCLLRRTKDFFCFFFILCFLEGVTAYFSRKGGKSGNIDLHYSLVARRIDLNWSYTWNVFF